MKTLFKITLSISIGAIAPLVLSGCSSSELSPDKTTDWARNHLDDLLIESCLKTTLSGYETDYDKHSWSGSMGRNNFDVLDFFIVKEVTVEELPVKLRSYFEKNS